MVIETNYSTFDIEQKIKLQRNLEARNKRHTLHTCIINIMGLYLFVCDFENSENTKQARYLFDLFNILFGAVMAQW